VCEDKNAVETLVLSNMDYGALETEIVGVLNTYFEDNDYDAVFEAREMPENQTELLQGFDKGQCNVAYMESSYGPPASTSSIMQMETVTVGVFMRCSAVRGAGGSHKLLEVVKSALTGYKPDDARSRMWVTEYAGWNIEDAQVGNMLAFRFNTVNVQGIVEPEADEVISAAGAVKVSGNLLEVESDLYDARPEPDVKIGEESVVLADE
jgi:hypothetical protein